MEEESEVVKTFAELGVREELVKACERLGWNNPSKIQAEALPYALEGNKVFFFNLHFQKKKLKTLCVLMQGRM